MPGGRNFNRRYGIGIVVGEYVEHKTRERGNIMKHVKTVSRVNVSPAQVPAMDIITTVISVFTAIGSVLGILVPLFEDKQK